MKILTYNITAAGGITNVAFEIEMLNGQKSTENYKFLTEESKQLLVDFTQKHTKVDGSFALRLWDFCQFHSDKNKTEAQTEVQYFQLNETPIEAQPIQPDTAKTRAEKELSELTEKAEKLEKFINSDNSKKLTAEARILLVLQLSAMRDYAMYLARRLKIWEE